MAKQKPKTRQILPKKSLEDVTWKDISFAVNKKNTPTYEYEDTDLDTPFGLIKMRTCELNYTIYGEKIPIVFDHNGLVDAIQAKDYIEMVVILEKAIDKYPKVSLFYIELAMAYEVLKKYDKSDEIIEKDFKLNKGLPLVDINYLTMIKDDEAEAGNLFYYGQTYNIHDAYPKQKYFHPLEITEFYFYLGGYALRNKKDIPLAEKCLATSLMAGNKDEKNIQLMANIKREKYPIKMKLFRWGLLILLIGIVVLILWGIYRLFAWIF